MGAETGDVDRGPPHVHTHAHSEPRPKGAADVTCTQRRPSFRRRGGRYRVRGRGADLHQGAVVAIQCPWRGEGEGGNARGVERCACGCTCAVGVRELERK